MAKSRQTSIYVSERTDGQIADLKSWGWPGNLTRFTAVAIDRLWRDEQGKEIERLQEALRPFAHPIDYVVIDGRVDMTVDPSDLERARAELKGDGT